MKPFSKIFFLELNRTLKKLNIFILLGFFLVGMLFIQMGINRYKENLESIGKFEEVERSKIEQYTTYTQYGAYGFRLLFVPSEGVIPFINSGLFSKANTFIDSGERLRIYNPLKGSELFDSRKNNYDFGGIILFFGSLMLLFYGYETFCKPSYLKFISSICGRRVSYFSIIAARGIFLTLITLLLFVCAHLLMLFNGISFPLDWSSLNYFLLVWVMTGAFFFIGTILGTIENKSMGLASLLLVWVFLTYFVPMLLNSLVWEKSSTITPIYQLEKEKLKLLMNFERNVLAKVGRLNEDEWNRKEVHDLYHSYLDNEFKQIKKKKKAMISRMKKEISDYQLLSTFFPTTFYRSVTDEISSRGYLNLIDFYEYGLEMKVDFFLYYAKKKYFSNRETVKPFITGNENVYYAESRWPENFGWGLLLNLCYVILLILAAYFRFLRQIHGKYRGDSTVHIDISSGKLTFLLTDNAAIKNWVYNFFTGVAESKSITVDGEIPVSKKFVYLPAPEELPFHSAYNLSKVLMKKVDTSDEQRVSVWETLFTFATRTGQVIIMDDFFRSIKGSEIVEVKRKIQENKLKLLYISKNEYLGYSIADKVEFSPEDHTVKPVKLLNC